MKRKALLICITIFMMSLFSSFSTPIVRCHSGDVVNVPTSTNIPVINGIFGGSEWTDGAEIHITAPYEAYLYIKYNGTHLFICADVVWDTSSGMVDYLWVYFDTNNDGNPTPGADDSFLMYAFPMYQHYTDDSAAGYNPTYHCDFTGHPGLIGGNGFGSSPNSGSSHSIFEIQIPLSVLGVTAGETVGFGAEIYNWDASQYTHWPTGMSTSVLTTWGDLTLTTTTPEELDISDVIQDPVLPTPSDDVDIYANITSTNVMVNTSIWYTLNGSGSNLQSMNLISGTLLDGMWKGTIPQAPQNTTIEYFVYGENNQSFSKKVGPFNYTVVQPTEIDPPKLANVSRLPLNPTDIDNVQLNISLNDVSGIKIAQIKYNLNATDIWIPVNMSLLQGTIYDGIWNVTIPAFANGTTVRYYFNATDNNNNFGSNPLDAPIYYYGYLVGDMDNEAPPINSTFITPPNPTYQENVTINTNINVSSEVSGLKNVTLCYSVNNQNLNYLEMSYIGAVAGPGPATQNASELLAINDTLGADSHFHDVLESWGGYNVTCVSLSDILADSSIADAYDVILVGDVSNNAGWNLTTASIIADTGKPIVARSEDGTDFVFALGMSYTDYSTLTVGGSNGQQINPAQVNHSVVNYPYTLPSQFGIDLSFSRTSMIFNTSDPNFDIVGYAETVTWNRVNLGHYKGYTNNSKIFLWAFEGFFHRDYVTTEVKNLCCNMVEFVYNLSRPGIQLPIPLMNFSVTLPIFSYGDIIYYNITSYDNAGNSYTTPTYNFTCSDPIDPDLEVHFTPSLPDNSQDVEVTVHAEEIGGSGIQNLTLFYGVNETALFDLESPHLVPNEYNYIWNITIPNCHRMELIFENITLEENFDYLYIYDENFTLIQQITGEKTNLNVTVFGNTTRIQLITDFAVESWGFLLSIIRFYYDLQVASMSLSTGTINNGNWTATIPKQANVSQITFSCRAFDFANNSADTSFISYIQSENTPPIISEIIQNPSSTYLQPSHSPTITVQASDNYGLLQDSLLLQYSDGGAWSNFTMDTNEISYLISSGNWTGIIPSFPDGTSVDYRVIAQDLANNLYISGTSSYLVDGDDPQLVSSSQTPRNPQYNESSSLKLHITDKYPTMSGSGVENAVLDYAASVNYLLESPHPYPNNYNTTWTISHSGSLGIAVHFPQITLSGGDFIEIYDSNNNLLQNITSSATNLWSSRTNTNSIKVRLITGSTGTNYGFSIDQYRTYYQSSLSLLAGSIYDGLWGVTIPAKSFGTTVWYNVTAKDHAQNSDILLSDSYTISDNYEPELIDILISNFNPAPDEDVNITLQISDSGAGIKDVSLILSTDGGLNWVTVPFSNATNIWHVTIPRQPDNTKVRFYIEIYDNSDNRLRNPAAGYYSMEFTEVEIGSSDWLLLVILAATAAAAVLFLLFLRNRSKISALKDTSKQAESKYGGR